MKQFIGKPLAKKSQRILGKITFKPIIFHKKNYVYVSTGAKVSSGYAAILVSQVQNLDQNVIVCNETDLKTLHDGDIVSIETNGVVKIRYEKNSIHNSLVVTERCNSRCIMCPNLFVTKEDDKVSSILKMISLIDKDTPLLVITGGEPTLLENSLIGILHACKKQLPKTELLMLSNGIKFSDLNYVKKIAAIKHPNLTIDIPLYSCIDTSHNAIVGTSGFYKTIQGLYNLAFLNQKIGIRIVVHKLNHDKLTNLAEFIYRNFPFVSHIAFMQMEMSGMAKTNIDSLWIDPYDYKEELEDAVLYLNRRGMRVSIYNSQLCILPKTLWKYAKKSISSWKNSFINECKSCNYINDCAGFFTTSNGIYSKKIQPV